MTQSSEWKPIESAPRDGTKFLGLLKDGRICTMAYQNRIETWQQNKHGAWVPDRQRLYLCEIGEQCISPRDATHWLPLPPAPTPEARHD